MITIISLADERYAAYMKVLVKSAAKNFPEAKLSCVLVNSDEDIPGCELLHEKTDLSGHDLECYCTNARAKLLKDLRQKRDGIIIWMDATTIIRKPCYGLIDVASKYDVCYRHKPEGGGWAGLLCVNDTDGGLKFVEEYYRMVSRDTTWYSNQDALNTPIEGVFYGDIPETYLDYKFNDSIVWTGKGRKIRSDNRWKQEMSKWGEAWRDSGSDPVSKIARFAKKDELKYWKKKKGRISDRGDRLGSLFDKYISGEFKAVADVGCGPRCGLFQARKFETMIAVDPLFDKYKKKGLAEIPEGVNVICAFADTFKLGQHVDLIVSFNSLDHSGDIAKSIANIMDNLKVGGLFLLHVHMRAHKELDDIHTMILTEGMLDNLFLPYTVIKKDIYESDKLYDKPAPRTYVAVVQK